MHNTFNGIALRSSCVVVVSGWSMPLTTKIEIAKSAFFNEIYRFIGQNDDAISRFDTFTAEIT